MAKEDLADKNTALPHEFHLDTSDFKEGRKKKQCKS